jgi:hypothetical protein
MQNSVAAEEYRYGAVARKRALLLTIVCAVTFAVLLGVLAQEWTNWGWSSRNFGLVLVLVLLGTARAQLARWRFRCRLFPDRMELQGLLSSSTVFWSDVVAVHRVAARQIGGERRWACTLRTRTARGTDVPVYAFDDQLDGADDAWATVVRSTPHAVHKG